MDFSKNNVSGSGVQMNLSPPDYFKKPILHQETPELKGQTCKQT